MRVGVFHSTIIFYILAISNIGAHSQDHTLQDEAKRIVSQYKAVFDHPPEHTPSKTSVDGPLLGNGDIGVTVSGPPEAQQYWLSKNDFWRLKSQYGSSGPRVFGGVDIDIPALKGANYRIEQNLYNAVTVSTFSQGQTTVKIRSWIAATQNALVLELETRGNPIEIEIHLRIASSADSETATGEENGVYWGVRKFTKEVDIAVEAACAMKLLGASGLKLTLQPGKTVTAVAFMESAFKSASYYDDVLTRSDEINEAGLKKLWEDHAEWWGEFWRKSWIEIGDPVIEQRYYLSQYVMGSCSRDPKFPPPIFGTWITTDEPGWFGDYHLNYNHMAPFYALYSSNHIEQADPYHAPILDFMARGKWYAQNVLNCRGVYYPVGIGPMGIETTRNCQRHADWHKEKGGLFFGQKSNTAYCVVNIAMRWRHTYEKEYARNVYSFVREVANFWEDYLQFEDERYSILNDAIHEGSGNGGDFNPLLSLGLVRNVFELAIDMSASLRIDAERHTKWKHILEHLSEFPTQKKDGKKVFRYTEKGTDWWNDNTLGIQHIYPAGSIGLENPADLLEISRNTIEVMNRWIDNNGMNSFFPAAVRVGCEPQLILAKLREMIARVGGPNGFIRGNPHGIENCSIVPNTINEMLCMGHKNVLRIFPVWPKDRDARFHRIRVVGAFLVSSELRNGDVQNVLIKSEKGMNCTVQNPWPGNSVTLYRNGRKSETLGGDRFTFKTDVNETIRLVGVRIPD